MVLALKIPALFLIIPCDDWACVFNRAQASDDRAFITDVGFFSDRVLSWKKYRAVFDESGRFEPCAKSLVRDF